MEAGIRHQIWDSWKEEFQWPRKRQPRKRQ
jgi:hypothetical protein